MKPESSKEALLSKISELLIKAGDDTLSPSESQYFLNLLKNNPQAREYYYDILSIFAGLNNIDLSFGKNHSGRKKF